MQGVLGYVMLRPLMTAVGFVASLIGVYGDGELRFDRVYLYTTIVSNISQVCHTPEQAAGTMGAACVCTVKAICQKRACQFPLFAWQRIALTCLSGLSSPCVLGNNL